MNRKILFATETDINQGKGYFPQDIRRLYNIPDELTGEGQTIGILEFSNGYSIRDAKAFWSQHGIKMPTVHFVSVDGTRNDGGRNPDDEEASLDLQWAGVIAPKADLVVYEASAGETFATFSQAVLAALNYILHDTRLRPTVLSISYGDAEASFDKEMLAEMSQLVSQLDNMGVTVCISSGDQGAYGMHDLNGTKNRNADAPASIPAAVAVGGTNLQPDGTETVWTYYGPENGGSTGGGFSSVFQRPSYQPFKEIGRGLPDISFNADPATGYQIIFQGQNAVVGGTSVSCPVFAGIVVLLNERRAKLGKDPIRNLTSILYTESANLPFRDITSGNNSFNGVTGYEAQPGWDACTGFGSIDASAFIEKLAGYDNPDIASGKQALIDKALTNQAILPLPVSHNPVVQVVATIAKVEPDVVVHEVHHHHILLRDIKVILIQGATVDAIKSQAFVAIRYGDSEGLPQPISGLAAGEPIELQGEYIPQNDAYPGVGNPGDPVIHFTHHPLGFIQYHGDIYR